MPEDKDSSDIEPISVDNDTGQVPPDTEESTGSQNALSGPAPDSEASVPDFTASEPATPPAHPELAITRPPKQAKSRKKLITFVIVLILLLGGAAGAYWYANKDKTADDAAANTQQAVAPEPAPEPAEAIGPNTVAYVLRQQESGSDTLFWQPASGGNKTAAVLTAGDYIYTAGDIYGKMIIVNRVENETGKQALLLSLDGGKAYSNIYESPAAEKDKLGYQVTSIKFSSDGSSVVYGLLAPAGRNSVMKYDIQSKKSEELFSSERAGVFIYGYSPQSAKIIYSSGCYNCDGNKGLPVEMYDLKNKTKSEVYSADEAEHLIFTAINKNLDEILVVGSTFDAKTAAPTMSGTYEGPPYTLSSVSLANGSKKVIATVGEKITDKAQLDLSDGSIPDVKAGYENDGKTPYYAYKNQVYELTSGKKTLLYEASKNIQDVYYVSQDTVISTSGAYNSFLLTNFSTKDKKLTTILSGDASTQIFGVTIN